MKIASGTTDQYIYFVAVDSTDLKTRETGLSSFTVYRSRDGAAAAAMTTPTVNETDSSNMPGVYELLLDEDMTIGAGNVTEEMVFHITQASMAPVTRTIELYQSINSTALTALEDQYDGTGLIGDTYPATQSQLSGIANVGSAIHRPAASYTLTTGTQSANTYTATEALDGIRHEHTDDTGAMELYYEFSIGSGTPSSCQVTGYVTGGNDDLDVYGYDWVATDWVQIGNIQGGGSTSNSVYSFDMFVDMVGTGANAGTVRVRFYKASGLTTALIAVDQIFVAFSQGAVSALDAVYFDSAASNTGTSSIDGVPGNPVSTEAAVNTLLAARNLPKVVVSLESSITFATSHVNEIWTGSHWVCANGGQDLSGSHFEGADVSGTATASADPIDYNKCNIGTCTLPQFHIENSNFNGTVTFGEAGDYLIAGSHSSIAGALTPIFDTGAAIANVNFSIADWQNGLELRNLNNSGTDLFSISGTGQVIYAASSSGAVNQRGDWKVTNTGGVTITADDNTTNVAAILVDTAEIGAAGAGLTDLGGMSAGMKAEVNTEVDTALDTVIPGVPTAGSVNDVLKDLDGLLPGAGTLSVLTAANVNSEVLDVMSTDTFAELGAIPAANSSLVDKITFNFMLARNKLTQTAAVKTLRDDADAGNVGTAAVSDDGTTYTDGEWS